jgi:hypothetical protein
MQAVAVATAEVLQRISSANRACSMLVVLAPLVTALLVLVVVPLVSALLVVAPLVLVVVARSFLLSLWLAVVSVFRHPFASA